MNVPSWEFLAFGLLAALVFNLSHAAQWRKIGLLATNLIFLSTFSHSPHAYLPFAAFLALGYLGVRLISEGSRRVALFFIIAMLLCFAWLKRYAFLPDTVRLPQVYVTVGVSYVFFRLLSLLIDRRDGALPGPIGPITYLNYALNFTSLVSGPIQRFEDYRSMETAEPPLSLDAATVGTAVERIVIGLFKVFVLSSVFIALQGNRIAALEIEQAWGAKVADGIVIALVYPLYLYLNFSGYTDFVIGIARFFRINLPENFDRPFAAMNFIEFWSRWHITLSSWLKTYVYAPLIFALMRRFPAPRLEPLLGVIAYFVTFFLVGIWHGQTSEFLFFGLLQGGGVAANKLYQISCEKITGRRRYRRICGDPLYQALARGLTCSYFAFSLLWFWSTWSQLGRMASLIGASGLIGLWLAAIFIATLVSTAFVVSQQWLASLQLAGTPLWSSRYLRTVGSTAMVVVIAVQMLSLSGEAPQIVYKAF